MGWFYGAFAGIVVVIIIKVNVDCWRAHKKMTPEQRKLAEDDADIDTQVW